MNNKDERIEGIHYKMIDGRPFPITNYCQQCFNEVDQYRLDDDMICVSCKNKKKLTQFDN